MDDPAMRAKKAYVARLLDTDPDYARHLETNRLIQFIDENPHYDIPGRRAGRAACPVVRSLAAAPPPDPQAAR
jgi:hypothetical protein